MAHTNYLLLLALFLVNCDGNRLRQLGDPPPFTQLENPTLQPAYRPITMPLPDPIVYQGTANSLWQPGARSFFKDQRAHQTGDILTVIVDLNDQGQLQNNTTASRNSSILEQINNAGGFESYAGKILPAAANPANLINMLSTPTHSGTGQINRKETINIKLAATVIQVLSNGNLVIQGRQEFRINQEMRELQILGIVRHQDISSNNTVPYEKIAEARISYDGRGDISYVQTPPAGQKVIQTLLPF
jgi:flagellar L-ring protein precursor FlgH